MTFATLAAALWLFAQPEIPPSTLAPARMTVDDGQDAMNSRLFRTTTARLQINLAGFWDFVPDAAGAGENAAWFRRFPKPETQLWVPGTWNALPRYWQYQGPGWLRRTFDIPVAGNLLLRFDGAFYLTKVWLDGEPLGEHEGGYLPFQFLVKVGRGPHTVTVRCDNRLGDATVPKKDTDWFPYGGIDRPVYAELVPDVWIERFHVTPGQGSLAVKAWVRNGGAAATRRVTFAVDGRELYAAQTRIAPGASTVTFQVPLAKPRLWSPEEPNLYSARLAVGGDDQFTRFGVRAIVASGPRIVLNGRRVKLRGVNRHDDHPDWGSALPPNLVRQDVEIIKRLGANAMRMHYPAPPLLLDYCDQAGLVFMAEIPAWQQRANQLAQPAVQEKMRRFFREMVERDYNHPAILSWSLGNEWPDPDRSYDIIKSLVDYARSVDRTHLLTFIFAASGSGRVHGLADIISLNWGMYQWYDRETILTPELAQKGMAELERIHERYPDKPIILTEFGGAESQAGWHNWGNVKWSEEYQARNVEDSGRYALQQDWISGGCVWQFCDARSAPERMLAGRLHGWNAKGVVDAYRQPKLAFYALQRLFSEFR